MIKILKIKSLVLISSLILSSQLFAISISQHNLKACPANNTKALYGIKSLCIGDEELIRKDLNALYGGNNVEYRTISNSYAKIISKNHNNITSWELTTKEGLTYVYGGNQLYFHQQVYTGTGVSQNIVTGIDSVDFTVINNGNGFWHDRSANIDGYVGGVIRNDAGVIVESGDIRLTKAISQVKIKSLDTSDSHLTSSGLTGAGMHLSSNSTQGEQGPFSTTVTAFTATGITIGSSSIVNLSTSTYILEQNLFTHLKWGVTNDGKRYITAYTPVTGKELTFYVGSGTASNLIPNGSSRNAVLATFKKLNGSSHWQIHHASRRFQYTTDAEILNHLIVFSDLGITFESDSGTHAYWNETNSQYILETSRTSETHAVIEYEGIGVLQDVEVLDVYGVKRNIAKATVKNTTNTGGWFVFDMRRELGGGSVAKFLQLNDASTEGISATMSMDFKKGTLSVGTSNTALNAGGVKYLAIVEFSNNENGDSYEEAEKENQTIFNQYKLKYIKDSSGNQIKLPISSSEIIYYYEQIENKLVLSEIKTKDADAFISNYSINYDGADAIIQSNVSSQGKNYLIKSYHYDENARLLRETISAKDIETRITKYVYDKTATSYSIKKINALGHITLNTYDLNDNLITSKDENNLLTHFEYNDQNKLIKKTLPNGNITNYEYSNTNLIAGASSKITESFSFKTEVIRYYDDKNRKIRTQKVGFNNRLVFEDITYDDQSRIKTHSLPYFKGETSYFIELLYDEENRVISISKPGLNNQRLITSYEYFEDTITITYPDEKTQSINLDTSIDSSNTYDILGNIISSTNERGQVTNYSYDELNRIIQKDIIQNNDEINKQKQYFVYDRANMGINKLAYIKSYEYKKEFYYDELSRLKANKIFMGEKIFANQYFYNQYSQLEKTISPDGFELINEYNDNGFLVALKSPKTKSVEASFDQLKDLITINLNKELELYKQSLDLEYKIKFYTLKKEVYSKLSPTYAVSNPEIKVQLDSVIILLNETLILLQHNLDLYKEAISTYAKIRISHLLTQAISNAKEENYQLLSELFETHAKEYVSLSSSFIDTASALLDSYITNPQLLNEVLNIDKDLVSFYISLSNEIKSKAINLDTQSHNYYALYENLRNGNGELQNSAYLGVFDDNEFKYFYKIIDQDALGRVKNEIYGNGLVSKKIYDEASGNLIRLITGYYGSNDIKDIKYTYDKNNNLLREFDVSNNITKSYKYDSLNTLISASNAGSNFYSNIAYSYSPTQNKYTYSQTENTFSSSEVEVGLNMPAFITEATSKLETIYSPNKESYKKIYTKSEEINTAYKINKNFKYQIKKDKTNYKNLIYFNDTLIALHSLEDIGSITLVNNYYIHKDVFSSIDIISNEAALIEQKIIYRPYGEQSNLSWTTIQTPNDAITNLGYKSYEHEKDFSLLDIGGYIYDASNAKTLSNLAISNLEEKHLAFFIHSSPTKYLDKKLDRWYFSFSKILNANIEKYLYNNPQALYNLEMTKEIKSLSSESSNIHIGDIEPSDTTKIWYKQNEDGSLGIYVFENGLWKEVGTTGSVNTSGSITLDSLVLLNKMPCFYQDSAFITISTSKKDAYTCNINQEWKKGGAFVGTYNLLELVNNLDAKEGSQINAILPNNQTKRFTKINAFWKDNTNSNIVALNLSDVKTNSMALDANAYISKDASSTYSLKKMSVKTSLKWVYQVSNLTSAVNDFEDLDQQDGAYIYVEAQDKTFKQIKTASLNFWTDDESDDGEKNASFIFTKGDRLNLPTVTHSLTALSKNLGSQERNTSEGTTSFVDSSFKQWFYSNSGVLISGLLDALAITNNPYSNMEGASVGYVIKDNKLLIRENNHWKYNNDYVDKDLIVRDINHIRPIGTTYVGEYTPPCTTSDNCYSLTSQFASYEAQGIIKFENGYWKNDGNKYLGKHYNVWFGDSNYANNTYYYEHSQYTKSDHRRVDNNQTWSKYKTKRYIQYDYYTSQKNTCATSSDKYVATHNYSKYWNVRIWDSRGYWRTVSYAYLDGNWWGFCDEYKTGWN